MRILKKRRLLPKYQKQNNNEYVNIQLFGDVKHKKNLKDARLINQMLKTKPEKIVGYQVKKRY